jgi:hypothetical protein
MQAMRYPFALVAVVAALASAVPVHAAGHASIGSRTDTRGGDGHAARPRDHRPAAERPTPCVGAALPTVIAGPGHTFSWADAGVGAAGAAGGLLALLGATLIVNRRHG